MTVGVEFDAANHASRICSEKGWTLGKLLGSGGSAAVFDVTTASGVAALKIFFPRFIEGKEGIVTRKRLDIVKGDHHRSRLSYPCSSLRSRGF